MQVPADAVRETWESIERLTLDLAAKIKTRYPEPRQQFDGLVVVPRGSYYPVNIIARQFGYNSTELLHACLSSYAVPGERQQFTLGQMPQVELIKGKRLVIIEEVCDTGHTLRFLKDWLIEQGADSVHSAVLHYKPGLSQTDFEPDWYVVKTDKWIVYPWEIYESGHH